MAKSKLLPELSTPLVYSLIPLDRMAINDLVSKGWIKFWGPPPRPGMPRMHHHLDIFMLEVLYFLHSRFEMSLKKSAQMAMKAVEVLERRPAAEHLYLNFDPSSGWIESPPPGEKPKYSLVVDVARVTDDLRARIDAVLEGR